MTLPISDIVPVTLLVAPQAPTARGFGVGFLLGTSTVLPLEERIRAYTTLTGGVDADFGPTTPEYQAASYWFGQQPAPSSPLLIGRRYSAAQAAKLRGSAAVSNLVSAYTGVSNGGFDIIINGVNRPVFGLDFSGATTMANVATVVQTALAAILASTTSTWNGKFFIIGSPTTGTASTISFGVPPTGGSSPVDVSTLLGLTAASGALTVNGIAAEAVTDALIASQAFASSPAFNTPFYGAVLAYAASAQDNKDTEAWGQGAKVQIFTTTNDPNAKLSAATTDLAFYAKSQSYDYAFTQYSNALYAAVSAMARAFVVDFDQPNSTITLMFKQEPGVVAESLTETDRLSLKGKNCNYYTSFGGFNMIESGVMANGRFQDEVHGLDWLQATVQNAVFGRLATAITKIPLTDAGAAMLVQAADGAFRKAVSNGLLAAGIWTGAPLGEVKTGDFLPNGFYIYAQPVAQMSQADRAARKAPPITAIGCGAGAIHTAALTFIFQR